MIDWLRQLDDIHEKSDELMTCLKETELKVHTPKATLADGFRGSVKQHKSEIINAVTDRWNPEYAQQGYVWCLDCQHFNDVNCNHSDNPFRTVTKCPPAPRKCQWYEEMI